MENAVVAEAHYVMGDSDTLAAAEERVLQRAQRKAVEEAGLYIESTFLDRENRSRRERPDQLVGDSNHRRSDHKN